MTAFETWFTEIAKALIQDDETAGRQIASTVEQRISIALVQARAAECRHLSGELLLHYPTEPLLRALSMRLSDRSHKLEQLALALCMTYPPDTPTEPSPSPLIVTH